MKKIRQIAVMATVIAGVCFCSATAQVIGGKPFNDSDSASEMTSLLRKPLAGGEAYIWYLLHCGYAVKTATRLLIFDYVRTTRDLPDSGREQSLASGRINPAELKDLDVYVFVSHGHEDHFDPIILEWKKQINNITYIFGWQATDDSSHYHLIGPRASLEIDGMNIYTTNCRSGVPEVSYLVKTDGLTIFFQGDCKSESTADIDYLLGKCDAVDMAFFGAATSRWPDASARVVRMIERLQPRVVFPMHFGGKEQTYEVFAQECIERGLSPIINCPKKPGDRFHYRR